MTADRFEVDTDQLRSAAARLTEISTRLGPSADSTDRSAGTPGTDLDRPTGGALGLPDPVDLLRGAGLDGWSSGSALAELGERWTAAVTGLAAEYADHAEQLRAAAERYDDAERIIEQTLLDSEEPRGSDGPC